MAANDPRVEFRPSSLTKGRLEELRQELSERAGRRFSLSEVVGGIVERFFQDVEKTSSPDPEKQLAFLPRGAKK